MIPVMESEDYLKRMLSVRRPGHKDVLAFYEHRLGAICTDPNLLLIPMDDHIVHRGDGIFETVKYVNRKIYQLDAHVNRMRKGAEAIGLNPPCTWDRLKEIIIEIAKAADEDNGLVRIMMGRGPGGFGIDVRECPMASLYVVAYRFAPKPQEWYDRGATAFKTSIPAKQDWIAQIKSVNYLPNVLMKKEATDKGYDYPMCFDQYDFLAEGATENMCIVDKTGLIVVPEFTNALPGTTLLRALELLAGKHKAFFRKVSENDIFEAREILVFGTTGECLPIVRYEGKPIHDARPGPVAKLALELLRKDIEDNGTPF